MKCRKLTFAYSLFLVHLQSCVVRCEVLHMLYVLHGRALGSGTKLHHPLTNNIVLISTYYKDRTKVFVLMVHSQLSRFHLEVVRVGGIQPPLNLL